MKWLKLVLVQIVLVGSVFAAGYIAGWSKARVPFEDEARPAAVIATSPQASIAGQPPAPIKPGPVANQSRRGNEATRPPGPPGAAISSGAGAPAAQGPGPSHSASAATQPNAPSPVSSVSANQRPLATAWP